MGGFLVLEARRRSRVPGMGKNLALDPRPWESGKKEGWGPLARAWLGGCCIVLRIRSKSIKIMVFLLVFTINFQNIIHQHFA
jgi:hypothetical protein